MSYNQTYEFHVDIQLREKKIISVCPEEFMALHVQEPTPHGNVLGIRQYSQWWKCQISNIHEALFQQKLNILCVHVSNAKE